MLTPARDILQLDNNAKGKNIHIVNSSGAERERAECYITPGYTWVIAASVV
jgi:hypothetical protein